MSGTFLISDNHFSDYDGPGDVLSFFKRPFVDTKDMNRAMIRNWNRVVGPDDTVYSMGDFSWTYAEMVKYAGKLNGRIHFILGNHDFEGDRVWLKKAPYQNGVFPFISMLTCNGRDFLLVHRPGDIPGWWDGWVIHGHHHWMLPRYPFIDGKNRTINVSCELVNYTPVDISQLFTLHFDDIARMDTISSRPIYKKGPDPGFRDPCGGSGGPFSVSNAG